MVPRARAAIAELERLRPMFLAIIDRTDDERRRILVDLRRQLSRAIFDVGAACEPIFATGPAAPLGAAYRALFSRVRSATALHQANWPAVAIDDDPAAYRASAMEARVSEERFLTWMHAVCDALEGRGVLPVAVQP